MIIKTKNWSWLLVKLIGIMCLADPSVLWYRVNAKSCGSLSGENQGPDSWWVHGPVRHVAAVVIPSIPTGCSFAGAGGGGFMSIICKAANGKEKLMQVIRSNKANATQFSFAVTWSFMTSSPQVLEDFVVYNVKVDMKGLHHTITSTDSHKTPTIIDHEWLN